MSLTQMPQSRILSPPKVECISREAIKKVHQEIFGSGYSFNCDSTDASIVSRPRSPKVPFPPPIIQKKRKFHTDVTLRKRPCDQSFGLILRRDKTENGTHYIEPGNCCMTSGLLPGDTILSVNGQNCEDKSVKELATIINSLRSNSLCLKVQPSDDHVEFSCRFVPIAADVQSVVERFRHLADPSVAKFYGQFLAQLADNLPKDYFFIREWIKERGSFSHLSIFMLELYWAAISQSLLITDQRNANRYVVGDRVWFSHREGYSLGTVAEVLSPNRVRLYLDVTHNSVETLLDELDHANPEWMEGVEDLLLLRHLNESAFVFNLHSRFISSLPYTYCGDLAVLALNPMRNLNIYTDSVKQLFFNCRERLDMPPHVYSVAQTALARLEAAVYVAAHPNTLSKSLSEPLHVDSGTPRFITCSRSSVTGHAIPIQAICFLGRSGSGKSIQTEHVLEYCVSRSLIAGNKFALSAPQIRAVFCLLDAFTCSRTLLNTNASRCLRLFTLEYSLTDENRQTLTDNQISTEVSLRLSRVHVDLFLLDKYRVTRRPEGEPTFHIFYYLLAGLQESYRREYMLDDLSSPNLFMTPLQRSEDKALAKAHWDTLCRAGKLLGAQFEHDFLHGVCRLLAVVYHLGCAGAAPGKATGDNTLRPPRRHFGFINFTSAERAASLLGCSMELLSSTVFGSDQQQQSLASDCSSLTRRPATDPSSLELLAGFVANLYAIATNTLRDLINKHLNLLNCKGSRTVARLLVVDPPGLQTPESGGRMSGGSFEDLLYNYTNECLLKLYQDGVSAPSWEKANSQNDPMPITTTDEMVAFLDTRSMPALASSASDGGGDISVAMAAANLAGGGQPGLLASHTNYSTEFVRRSVSPESDTIEQTQRIPTEQNDGTTGLLWLLDSAVGNGDLQVYLRLVSQKYQEHKQRHSDRGLRVLRRLHRSGAFSLNHWNTTVPVQYHPAMWLSSCHTLANPRSAIDLLQSSTLPLLASIGDSMDEGASPSTLSASSASGLAATFISDVKYVIGLLRSCSLSLPCNTETDSNETNANICGVHSDVHWVHCLLPVANAGLCHVFAAAATVATSLPPDYSPLLSPNPGALVRFCVPLVRSQIRALTLSPDLVSSKPLACERFLASVHIQRSSVYPLIHNTRLMAVNGPTSNNLIFQHGLVENSPFQTTPQSVHIDETVGYPAIAPDSPRHQINTLSISATKLELTDATDNECGLESVVDVENLFSSDETPTLSHCTKVVDPNQSSVKDDQQSQEEISNHTIIPPKAETIPESEDKTSAISPSTVGSIMGPQQKLASLNVATDSSIVNTVVSGTAEPPSESMAKSVPVSKSDAATLSSGNVPRSPSSSTTSTYNFIYGSSGKEFPWDQFLSLSPSDRSLIKHLRNQLEDLEETKENLLRKQRLLQMELDETHQHLNEQQRERQHAEARCLAAQRRNSELASRVDELEENVEELTVKQRRSQLVAQTSAAGATVVNSSGFLADELSEITEDRNNLRSEVAALQERLTALSSERTAAIDVEIIFLKSRVRELEGRVELECSAKTRLQSTVDRLKEQLDQRSTECDRLISSLQVEREATRRATRSLREAEEDRKVVERRLCESERQRTESTSEVESLISEKTRLQEQLAASNQTIRRQDEHIRRVVMCRRRSSVIDENLVDYDDNDDLISGLSHASGQSSRMGGLLSGNGSEFNLTNPSGLRNNRSRQS